MTGRSVAHVSALKIAAAAAGVLLLAATTVFLLEVVSAIAHLGLAFLYAFSGGVS